MGIDDWIEVEISSRKKKWDGRIDELINGLRKGDTSTPLQKNREERSISAAQEMLHIGS
jgi:hypothetical protein